MQPIDRTILLKTKNTSVISSKINRKKYLVVTFKVTLMFNYIHPLSFQSERKPLSTSEHGLKTVDIYHKYDHKIANTLTKKAKFMGRRTSQYSLHIFMVRWTFYMVNPTFYMVNSTFFMVNSTFFKVNSTFIWSTKHFLYGQLDVLYGQLNILTFEFLMTSTMYCALAQTKMTATIYRSWLLRK